MGIIWRLKTNGCAVGLEQKPPAICSRWMCCLFAVDFLCCLVIVGWISRQLLLIHVFVCSSEEWIIIKLNNDQTKEIHPVCKQAFWPCVWRAERVEWRQCRTVECASTCRARQRIKWRTRAIAEPAVHLIKLHVTSIWLVSHTAYGADKSFSQNPILM